MRGSGARPSFYIDKALDPLRAVGYPLLPEDVARLSPFVRKHINVIGTYSFTAPDLGPSGVRDLRDPDADDEEE
ncbi:Tn3 family transposase [Nonomuraea diastatica]|uniref:Tn3 transposase DDE domain-containing protein n=1 Tax=Nonomuraea diastatica TaxID=1848329 RepID=A0A4R4WF54_9ACTN|nr:Tn3 family transposase [Nonomuraea diastatica]TDD14893.1 hypothetical protein E1294_36045 [Nonomuraea diastatica]